MSYEDLIKKIEKVDPFELEQIHELEDDIEAARAEGVFRELFAVQDIRYDLLFCFWLAAKHRTKRKEIAFQFRANVFSYILKPNKKKGAVV